MSPARRRRAVEAVSREWEISQRRACRILEQPRSTQRHARLVRDDEGRLTARIVALAREYGRYGYRPPAPEAIRPVPAALAV